MSAIATAAQKIVTTVKYLYITNVYLLYKLKVTAAAIKDPYSKLQFLKSTCNFYFQFFSFVIIILGKSASVLVLGWAVLIVQPRVVHVKMTSLVFIKLANWCLCA